MIGATHASALLEHYRSLTVFIGGLSGDDTPLMLGAYAVHQGYLSLWPLVALRRGAWAAVVALFGLKLTALLHGLVGHLRAHEHALILAALAIALSLALAPTVAITAMTSHTPVRSRNAAQSSRPSVS